MSRWHERTCDAPLIVVAESGTPHCNTCGAEARLTETIPAASASDPFESPPPDEPLDQMSLWWPPCVPYRQGRFPDDQSAADTPAANNALVRTAAESHPQTGSQVDSPLSPLYGETLGENEFRLLCLSAEADPGVPIHCDLETHLLDDCPEYEAVSYAWGGEDGDSTRCWPLFVGPFWDVLLQTKNCCDMLRHMRRCRGHRLIWVDAVCINQRNMPERGRQVACMTRIYSQCIRVVLYLGADLAPPLQGRTHPNRRSLHELHHPDSSDGGGGTPRLLSILQRRYFTRVWVVQELILPRQVVVRVVGTDFYADAATPDQLRSTPAGWAGAHAGTLAQAPFEAVASSA